MLEIGGYLELDSFINNEFYPDLIAVNSARNALVYLLKAKDIKKVYIPCFLCDSIFKVCQREGVLFEYYDIDKSFKPIFEKHLKENEYLYIVNYYGQLSDEYLLEMKRKHEQIIVDNVQAFFQKPINGVDTVYSCRKFFGVADGGYVYTTARLDDIAIDVSCERMKHVLARYDEGNASKHYNDFKSNEECFESLPLRSMSKLTRNILGAIDYNRVKVQRENNFSVLENGLSSLNKLNVKKPEGPYAYPFYCENGLKIKRELAAKGIYIPTLWPEAISFGGISKEYSENILPLPCDQRYSSEEMKAIVKEIKLCMKN